VNEYRESRFAMQQSNKIEAAGLICLGLRTHCSDNPGAEEKSAMLVWEEDRTTENVHAASTATRAVSALPSALATRVFEADSEAVANGYEGGSSLITGDHVLEIALSGPDQARGAWMAGRS